MIYIDIMECNINYVDIAYIIDLTLHNYTDAT